MLGFRLRAFGKGHRATRPGSLPGCRIDLLSPTCPRLIVESAPVSSSRALWRIGLGAAEAPEARS
jgi:hypothetical protein